MVDNDNNARIDDSGVVHGKGSVHPQERQDSIVAARNDDNDGTADIGSTVNTADTVEHDSIAGGKADGGESPVVTTIQYVVLFVACCATALGVALLPEPWLWIPLIVLIIVCIGLAAIRVARGKEKIRRAVAEEAGIVDM